MLLNNYREIHVTNLANPIWSIFNKRSEWLPQWLTRQGCQSTCSCSLSSPPGLPSPPPFSFLFRAWGGDVRLFGHLLLKQLFGNTYMFFICFICFYMFLMFMITKLYEHTPFHPSDCEQHLFGFDWKCLPNIYCTKKMSWFEQNLKFWRNGVKLFASYLVARTSITFFYYVLTHFPL